MKNKFFHHFKFSDHPEPLATILYKICLLTLKSAFTYFPAIFIFNLLLTLPLIYLSNVNYTHPYNIIPLFAYSLFIIILGALLAVILVRSLDSFARTEKFQFQDSIIHGLKKIVSVIGLLILAYICFFVIMFIGISTRDLIIRYTQIDPMSRPVLMLTIIYATITSLIVFMSFLFTIPAIAIENKSAFASLLRSLSLVFRCFWRSFSVFFIALIPIFIIEIIIFMSFQNIFKLTSIENIIPYILFEVIWSMGVSLLYSCFVVQFHDAVLRHKMNH